MAAPLSPPLPALNRSFTLLVRAGTRACDRRVDGWVSGLRGARPARPAGPHEQDRVLLTSGQPQRGQVPREMQEGPPRGGTVYSEPACDRGRARGHLARGRGQLAAQTPARRDRQRQSPLSCGTRDVTLPAARKMREELRENCATFRTDGESRTPANREKLAEPDTGPLRGKNTRF